MSIPTLWPHPTLQEFWETTHRSEGATQPHLQALLYAFVCALDTHHVAELGVWKGATSRWLACAVAANGGGSITLVDTCTADLVIARDRVAALGLKDVEIRTVNKGSMEFIPDCDPATGFIFMDDDKQQVAQKLAALRTRVPHCVVAIHDAETLAAEMLKTEGILHILVPHVPSSGNLGLVNW